MLDTDALQIININIDSIDAEDAGNSEQNINTGAAQEFQHKAENSWGCEVLCKHRQHFRIY